MRLSPALLALTLACGGSGPGPKDRDQDPIDNDADGFTALEDCDDASDLVFPGAEDTVGDGVDNNCDGVDGVDADGDGQPGVDSGGLDCDDANPAIQGVDGDNDGAPSCTDCDDADPAISPLATEVCDGVDTDCDGRIDQNADDTGGCSQDFLAANRLDLMLVVDNSCSMAQEQADLSLATATLTSELLYTGIDYHLGVISTDMNDSSHSGRLREVSGVRWIDPVTPNASSILQQMIEMGTGGSATEKGVDATNRALLALALPGAFNDGFRRTDADLAVVIVSDESDFSTDVTPPDLVNTVDQTVDPGFRGKIHAKVSPSVVCPTASTPGDTYIDLAQTTGGVFVSICDTGWDQFLVDVVGAYEPHHLGVYELDLAIVPDSVAVDITTPSGTDRKVPPDVSWDPATWTVNLATPPAVDAEITVWFTPAP